MDVRSFGPQLATQIVAQFGRQLGEVAGTAAGQQASQLLSQILGSAFTQGGPQGGVASDQRFPSPVQQFGQALKNLGVMAQTIGEVLNSLDKLLGGNRNFPSLPGGATGAPSTGAGAASGGGAGGATGTASGAGATGGNIGDLVDKNEAKYLSQMSPEQQAMYKLQKSANRQAEAAALMSALLKAAHDARQGILQKI